MSKEKNNPTPKRKPTFVESIIPIVAMLIILTVGKGVLGYATEPLLLLVAAGCRRYCLSCGRYLG